PAAVAALASRWATNVLDAPAPHTTRIRIDLPFHPQCVRDSQEPSSRLPSAPAERRLPRRRGARLASWRHQSSTRKGGRMTRQRQDRLLAVLLRQDSWATAASLADQLGVTPRSIRSYVAALNARPPAGDAVESGPAGHRAGPRAVDAAARPDDIGTPRARLHRLARTLIDEADGIDVYDTALALHISETTLENDLSRVRALLEGGDVRLERDRDRVRLRGDEQSLRRLLS